MLGDVEGDTDGLSDGLTEIDTLGDTDILGLILGLIDGDTDTDGLMLILGEVDGLVDPKLATCKALISLPSYILTARAPPASVATNGIPYVVSPLRTLS